MLLTGSEWQFIRFLCSVVKQCPDRYAVLCVHRRRRRLCHRARVIFLLTVLVHLTLPRTDTTKTHCTFQFIRGLLGDGTGRDTVDLGHTLRAADVHASQASVFLALKTHLVIKLINMILVMPDRSLFPWSYSQTFETQSSIIPFLIAAENWYWSAMPP